MYDQLIQNIIKNSLHNNLNGKVISLFSFGLASQKLMRELSEAISKQGGIPDIEYEDERALKHFLAHASDSQIEKFVEMKEHKARLIDASVRIMADEDIFEMKDTPNYAKYRKLYNERVRDALVLTKPWVILQYPTPAFSTMAGMSFEEFEKLWLDVSSLDYSKMSAAFEPAKKLLESADRVRIVGKGTDLSFSIKGLPAIPCAGECNIPDGEIYTAPVKDSVNGTVQFNTPIYYSSQGVLYENIRLEFKNGQAIKWSADKNSDKLDEFFATDDGSRFIGEFALGVNPHVKKPLGEILFDEKISGSFHLALGRCYDECDNGNRSSNHFDMVCIQTPEYGGGEIYFDDVLIRKDGRFVPAELQCLNPESLV